MTTAITQQATISSFDLESPVSKIGQLFKRYLMAMINAWYRAHRFTQPVKKMSVESVKDWRATQMKVYRDHGALRFDYLR